MTSNAVVWFEIYVNDMNRARKFYESVLDTHLKKLDTPNMGTVEFEMWTFAHKENAPGCNGALVKTDNAAPGTGGTMIYFTCEDCANEEARASQNGGEVVRGKFSIAPHGFIAIAKDTEGNVIGFHSMT